MVHDTVWSLQARAASITGGRVFPFRGTHVIVDGWLDRV
jgi:hypothetical protein